MQVAENDRVESEGTSGGNPRIRYYARDPGLLRTAFNIFWANGGHWRRQLRLMFVLLRMIGGMMEGRIGCLWI